MVFFEIRLSTPIDICTAAQVHLLIINKCLYEETYATANEYVDPNIPFSSIGNFSVTI